MKPACLESHLVNNCAPTLASIKTGNLFTYRYDTEKQLKADISRLNKRLYSKGITIHILRQSEHSALIYVCRLSKLRQDFDYCGVREFMSACGYSNITPLRCINELRRKLNECPEFPHEIGLFLGYPLEDVQGFIDNGGKNCLCSGCWKVYCNCREAQKQFAKFDKCRMIYCRMWEQGRTLSQLTVKQHCS